MTALASLLPIDMEVEIHILHIWIIYFLRSSLQAGLKLQKPAIFLLSLALILLIHPS